MDNLHPQGYNPYEITEYQHIGAKQVAYQVTFSDQEMMMASSDAVFKQEIRKKLVAGLVEHLLDQKLVELVQIDDPIYQGKRVVARLCLLPDTQIRIIRENKP